MSYSLRPGLFAAHCNKKLILLLALVIIAWICVLYQPSYSQFRVRRSKHVLKNNKSIECYRYVEDTLPDISAVDVKKGKSIFFHETSCNSYINDKIVINPREACAVESAALMNPNMDVYLTYTSPGVFKFEGTESDRFLKVLMSYDNVRINYLNYEMYTKGTPVEDLYSKGSIEASKYSMSHASDVLRFLTLWKYGGIYLDLDIIVIRSIESLPPNFSGCESDDNVGSSIIGYGPSNADSRHKLAEECLIDLRDNFNGTIWGHNGPGVVTRLAKKHCDTEDVCNKTCDEYKIFSTNTFFPIPWQSWKQYFEENELENVMQTTQNSYIVHVWNKHSFSTKIPIQSKNAYATFARKYCPKVFQQCDTYF